MTVPSIDGILEAALYAEDLDAARAFYGEIMGLTELVAVPGRHIFFRAGSTVLLIFNPKATADPLSNPTLPVPPHGAQGPGHLCFAASSSAIEKWHERLSAAGCKVEADFRWPGGARSIYFRDPAGNSLEIAEPQLWFE